MKDCEKPDLIRLEGQYLKFIIKTHSELNLLEHIEKCETCRTKIKKTIEKDQHTADFGNLFDKQVDDKTVPQFTDYKKQEDYMNARIQWRKKILKQLMKNAEIELRDLQTKIKAS